MGLAGLVPEGSRGETSSLPISASGGCQHSSVHDPFLKSLQPLPCIITPLSLALTFCLPLIRTICNSIEPIRKI